MKPANPINISHIDHVVIRVNNLENMIAFYQGVLGCKLERGPGEGGLAQLRAGYSLIDLVDSNGPLGQQGGKDRSTFFPKMLHEPMRRMLENAGQLHKQDLKRGFGEVSLPDALSRKYPKAGSSIGWQYAFPSTTLSADPRNGLVQRYHLHISALRKAINRAKSKTNISKRVTTHVFRHSFATHLLEDGVNIRTIQTLLGHNDVKTTEIYTHVMNKSLSGIKSPLENL